MRVAIYARVSTEGQENENQLIILRRHVADQGWPPPREFVDEAISGSKASRPALDSMMHAAQHKGFDLLLFWSLDRLSREGALATLQHLQRLTTSGVAWRSHTEPWLDSLGPLSDAIVALIGTIARMERTRISERTKAGLARAVAQGKRLGPPPLPPDVIAAVAAEPALSQRVLAARLGISKSSVLRLRRASR